MNKLEQILKSIAQSVFLSNEEKKEMRAGLESYVAFHSVRKESPERLHTQRPYFYSLLFLRKKTMPIILILALLFGGGGVSYAAEGAVPGDALYPIKIGVNEEVRSIVALTPEAKADWESRRVERRLEEAENLVAGDAFSPNLQGFIEEEIAEHIEKVETHLAKVEEKKDIARASEISSNLETVLRVHGDIFVKIKERQAQKIAVAVAATAGIGPEAVATDAITSTTQSFTDDRLGAFSVKLAEKAEKIAARNETHLETIAFEDAPGRKVSAESQAKSAKKHLTELTRLYEERKAEMTDEIRAEFKKRIADARGIFEKGNEASKNGNYGEAFLLYQDARAVAQKIAVHIKSYFNAGVSVKEEDEEGNVKGGGVIAEPPDLLPKVNVTYTKGEERETAEMYLKKAGVLLEEVRQSLEKHRALLPDDVLGRIKTQMMDAENLITEGKRALEAKEYGVAYLSAQKAMHILRDVQEIIRKYAASSDTDSAQKLERARIAAESAMMKAKQTISSSDASDEAIRKARALYEEASFAFSKGMRAAENGDAQEAIELFLKVTRIIEEIFRLLGGTAYIKPYPIEPMPFPIPKLVPVPEPVACTKEYAPVCGSVNTGIVCIKAPCPTTVEKTYGNACEARAAGAAVVYKGECRVNDTREKKETKTVCDYAAPPQGCSYVKGATYNATTGCGLVLSCVSVAPTPTKTEILPVKTEVSPATTNTTETKTEDEVKTEPIRYY